MKDVDVTDIRIVMLSFGHSTGLFGGYNSLGCRIEEL
jgi:hypothetical protein